MKDQILKFVNKPAPDIQSSQTLYEALFTSINMDLLYSENTYKEQAEQVARLIIRSQLEDGGFDIGYNFSFGKNMKKQNRIESTTPEILSVYALIKYYDIYRDESVRDSIYKGVEWIRKHAYRPRGKGYWVIPYAPCSYKEVHITNATSFAVATLVYYMHVFQDNTVQKLCDGMFLYLKDELIIEGSNGYWNYFEKRLMADPYYVKVDNYHIAQQLFYHMSVNRYYENDDNKTIIKLVGNYLKSKLQVSLHVPYIEVNKKKTTDIHTWGYCFLLPCSLFLEEEVMARDIKCFIIDKMWGGTHFYPVVKSDGKVVDGFYYPRSDAWILHSFSEYLLYEDEESIKKVVDIGLLKLKECDYKGLENHVLTLRKKLFNKCVILLKKMIGRKKTRVT